MTTQLADSFWSRIGHVQAGMLEAQGERPIPMAPHADRDEKAIWFVTRRGSATDRAAHSGAEAVFQVADPKANLYAHIEGKIDIDDNDAKLDEIWSATHAAWFENGRDDADVRLVRMTPHQAEIWATEGTAGYLYEIARATLTDDTADPGERGRIAF